MSSDIRIRQGNNPAQVLVFPRGMDLTGYVLQLNVVWQGNRKTYNIGSGLSLEVAGTGLDAVSTVTWRHSAADTLEFPIGRVAQYEIEFTEPTGSPPVQRSGGGYLLVEEGINLDA